MTCMGGCYELRGAEEKNSGLSANRVGSSSRSSRCPKNVGGEHPRQSRLEPPNVAVKVLRGRATEGLDELAVTCVKRVHVLNVIAASGDLGAWLAAYDVVRDARLDCQCAVAVAAVPPTPGASSRAPPSRSCGRQEAGRDEHRLGPRRSGSGGATLRAPASSSVSVSCSLPPPQPQRFRDFTRIGGVSNPFPRPLARLPMIGLIRVDDPRKPHRSPAADD